MYSSDAKLFKVVVEHLKAREGRWTGAWIGFFFTRSGWFYDARSPAIDRVRFGRPLEIR